MQSKTLLPAVLAASLMGLAGMAQAAPAVVAVAPSVHVQAAPPPPLYEAMPAPRAGYVWSPGHFVWSGDSYVWRPGQWLTARPGYVWQPAQWAQRSDGSWYLSGGAWVPGETYGQRRRGDRDGDGVRNREDWDRDGDGIANWDDDFPNDYYRS